MKTLLVAVALCLMTACASPVARDIYGGADGGSPVPHTAQTARPSTGEDAGAPPLDAAMPDDAEAPTPEDAGSTPQEDAAPTPEVDAAPPPPVDAGVEPDASVPPPPQPCVSAIRLPTATSSIWVSYGTRDVTLMSMPYNCGAFWSSCAHGLVNTTQTLPSTIYPTTCRVAVPSSCLYCTGGVTEW